MHDRLPNIVDWAFRNREIDIVPDLVLAAAMIYPPYVYTTDVFTPAGGSEAIVRVMERYYRGDAEGLNLCMMVYGNYRHRMNRFFGNTDLTTAALKNGPAGFWQVAHTYLGGCELFIKLCCGYCGQGASERLNKQVKQIRSINRNRQSHEVTSAYLELKHYYNFKADKYVMKEQSLICAIKEKLEDRRAQALERVALENMIKEYEAASLSNDEDADFDYCFMGIDDVEEEEEI